MNHREVLISIIIAFIAAIIFGGIFFIFLYGQNNQIYQMPSMIYRPSFEICEIDSDCIHTVTMVGDVESPATFENCINKNYKEADLNRYYDLFYDYYGSIEKTEKDLCECSEKEPKSCRFKTNTVVGTENFLNWQIFQDRKNNPPKGTISLDVNVPLSRETACMVAEQACNSKCVLAAETENLSRLLLSIEQSVGKFDWEVHLEPICGDLRAYINEKEKTVVCWCAYE